MAIYFLSCIALALALSTLWVSARLLLRGSWFQAWLKGSAGLVLLFIATVCVIFIFDLLSYRQALNEQSLATISFTQQGSQRYEAVLTETNGNQHIYALSGDAWQVDARFIKLADTLIGLGLSSGYRLERISGRYYSLEQEQTAKRSVYSINASTTLDSWIWLDKFGQFVGVVDARYGSATFLPMADGAIYEIKATATGLLARPINERARSVTKNI